MICHHDSPPYPCTFASDLTISLTARAVAASSASGLAGCGGSETGGSTAAVSATSATGEAGIRLASVGVVGGDGVGGDGVISGASNAMRRRSCMISVIISRWGQSQLWYEPSGV